MANFIKNYKSSLILMSSLIIGGIIGGFVGPKIVFVKPIADIFLNLLYCSVVPMVFISLVSAIAKMEDLKKLRKILLNMLVIFIVTGVIAAIFMIIICVIFKVSPNAGDIVFKDKVSDLKGNSDILSMLTVNDFPLLWSRQNLTALIVFAIFIGIACATLGEKASKVITLFDQLTNVIMQVVTFIMKLAPIGLGCYFAILIGEQGSSLNGPLVKAVVIFLVSVICYYILSTTVFGFIGAGRQGVKALWKNILPPTMTALGTSSSAATLPINIDSGLSIGIPEDVNNIVLPLGANLHKDGAVLIQILKIFFLAPLFNVDMAKPSHLITAIAISVLASSVMGAVPAGGYAGEIFLMSAFGFPPTSIPVMVLLGTITDAPATAVNCTGDLGVAMIVSRIVHGKDWLKLKLSGDEA
ncbi:dicarboxylate/amino acid:cation symporter [Enterococcus faecalis]|nr:dicarboxylate/amino acid:cation symporter [Enterococcus faecalis]EIA6661009.1 dicarboxylate/amino acid:cation symporter [Enterococcus faecalis]